MRSRRLILLITALIAVLAVVQIPLSKSRAADAIVITIAVPDNSRDIFEQQLINDFQAANPGITLQLTSDSGGIADVASAGLDSHLQAVQKFVSSADVLFVNSNRISVEATLAGLYLDLAPLVAADSSINTDDFFPNVWQSFQWDKGIWALPTAADIQVLTYDPAQFDAINLAYPDPKWTFDDLANAARKLIQKNDRGEITRPGIGLQISNFDALLLRSLLGEGVFDSSTIPAAPALTKPQVAAMLDAYYQLQKDGAIGRGGGDAPMAVGSILQALLPNRGGNNNTTSTRVSVLLPGGKAGLNVQGFAVSGGTQHPNEAYAVAKWLTTRAEVSNRFVASPARKSLVGQQGNNQGLRLNISPEIQKVIDEALAVGIPTSELRYTNRIAVALQAMQTKNEDAQTALSEAEQQAVADIKAAQDKRGSTTITMATPVPDSALPADKVALKFGFSSFVNPLPNQDKWDKLIADFVASDPQVGKITFETTARGGFDITSAAKNYDCFYLTNNAVPSAQLDTLLPLDPLMASDTTFDKNDYVGNVLAQVQRDNKIWALPITVQPTILRYDPTRFANAGATLPKEDWTVADFNNALKALKINPGDPPPFIPSSGGGTHLLILIAAYGGMPLDYRTNPVTINYTDAKTVDAIRQVLDLAKNGYIQYEALGEINFGFGRGGGNNSTASILNAILNAFTFQPPQAVTNSSKYEPIPYPRGNDVAAISYSISAGYISATSKAPEACYRWLSKIAQSPELFSAMPVRRSKINDPAVTQTQSPSVTALYNQVDKLLQDPATVSIPALNDIGNSPSTFLMQYWLYQAFDSYVLKNGDLETGLKEAETYSKAFQECVATLPPLDLSSQANARQYLQQFGGCAVKADPRLKPLLGLIS